MAILSNVDLSKLGVVERLELIEEIWESIASDPSAVAQLPLTDEERALLDERIAEHRADPSAGQPWADVLDEIRKQR